MFPTKATGIYFNQRGHSISDLRITILEKMKTSDESYRKEEKDTSLTNLIHTIKELSECLCRLYLVHNCKINLS